MRTEILDFKTEKKEAYLTKVYDIWLGANSRLGDGTKDDLRSAFEDCFNAAFDFALDAKEMSPTEEEQKLWDLEEQRSTVRRTALEMLKSDWYPVGDTASLIDLAMKFEQHLKEKVL